MHSFKKNKFLGNTGEKLVAKFLQKNKFQILALNYRTKLGEIDIVAQKKNLITFVEVKTRKNEYFSTSNVVNKTKQKKIIKAAQHFILKNRISDKILRFDVATVLLKNNNSEIKYISNAFTKT